MKNKYILALRKIISYSFLITIVILVIVLENMVVLLDNYFYPFFRNHIPLYKERYMKKLTIKKIDKLLERGIDINYVDGSGTSLLMCAIMRGNSYEVIEKMINEGANVNPEECLF
jgi:ankyrin repeat protein